MSKLTRSQATKLLLGKVTDQPVLGGMRGAMFAQNSGLGNCVNALASLAVPWQIPVLMFLGQRGELGEFNVSQVGMGRATRPILDALGIPRAAVPRKAVGDSHHERACGFAFFSLWG